MVNSNLKFVIVGHVDHGKSTLIGRLLYETKSLQEGLIKEIKSNLKGTGIKMEFAHIMDYYEEERRQERTIDTTQFFFKIKNKSFTIIDTPGHKEFIKNMITGSSQAQVAILIISAKEGVEEQTKRHAYILKMLGIKQVILVINKMDLVEFKQDRFEEIKLDAGSIITFLGIRQDNIIPISAKEGDNISHKSKNIHWYKGFSLVAALQRLKMRQFLTKYPLRIPIQDIYKINGKKIIVGKVISGVIRAGEDIIVYPHNIKTKAKSIEVFNKKTRNAQAGQSIGIVLEDDFDVKRGQVICGTKEPPEIKNKIRANIFWLSDKRFNIKDELYIKCATFEEKCKIDRIRERIDSSSLDILERDGNFLEETQVGKVTISIDRPMVVEDFNIIEELGRFVLLRGNQVCAGGIVTEQ